MTEQHRFEQYDALIFDMDGTLVDSMPLHLDAWEQTVILETYSLFEGGAASLPRPNYEQAIVSELTMRSVSRGIAASAKSGIQQVIVFGGCK